MLVQHLAHIRPFATNATMHLMGADWSLSSRWSPLEMIIAATTIGALRFRLWSGSPNYVPHTCPFVTNATMNFVCTRRRRPIDRAILIVAVVTKSDRGRVQPWSALQKATGAA